jgi:predicted aminopeptidase
MMNPCRAEVFNHMASAWARLRSGCKGLTCLVAISLLGACTSAEYYGQAAAGHAELLLKAKPVDDWLQDPSTSLALKSRLKRAQAIREFASTSLHLPRNASYTRYADLNRPALLWNVVAAPPLSLKPYVWCFPVAGCVPYKGFFNHDLALHEARLLEQEGLEVRLYPVPAYSTLGWSNWMGGDPLLNTFLGGSEANLARLIFHELAHQQVYVSDDSAFNEAFASTVEQLGGALWMQSHANMEQREQDTVSQLRQQQFRNLTGRTRLLLEGLYTDYSQGKISQTDALTKKHLIMTQLRNDYAKLKDQWQGYAGYDRWIEQANNASFVSQATYEKWIPALTHLFELQQKQWPLFYDAVSRLARLSASERQQALEKLMR